VVAAGRTGWWGGPVESFLLESEIGNGTVGYWNPRSAPPRPCGRHRKVLRDRAFRLPGALFSSTIKKSIPASDGILLRKPLVSNHDHLASGPHSDATLTRRPAGSRPADAIPEGSCNGNVGYWNCLNASVFRGGRGP